MNKIFLYFVFFVHTYIYKLVSKRKEGRVQKNAASGPNFEQQYKLYQPTAAHRLNNSNNYNYYYNDNDNIIAPAYIRQKYLRNLYSNHHLQLKKALDPSSST